MKRKERHGIPLYSVSSATETIQKHNIRVRTVPPLVKNCVPGLFKLSVA